MIGQLFDSSKGLVVKGEYDFESRYLTLYFRDGEVWEWEGVPKEVFEQMKMSLDRDAYYLFVFTPKYGEGRKVEG